MPKKPTGWSLKSRRQKVGVVFLLGALVGVALLTGNYGAAVGIVSAGIIIAAVRSLASRRAGG
jgi:uncharacterized membrane protein